MSSVNITINLIKNLRLNTISKLRPTVSRKNALLLLWRKWWSYEVWETNEYLHQMFKMLMRCPLLGTQPKPEKKSYLNKILSNFCIIKRYLSQSQISTNANENSKLLIICNYKQWITSSWVGLCVHCRIE